MCLFVADLHTHKSPTYATSAHPTCRWWPHCFPIPLARPRAHRQALFRRTMSLSRPPAHPSRLAVRSPNGRLVGWRGADCYTATAAAAPHTAHRREARPRHADGGVPPTDGERAHHGQLTTAGTSGGCSNTTETTALGWCSTGAGWWECGRPAQATTHPCDVGYSEHWEIPDPSGYGAATARPPTGPPGSPPSARA